MTDMTPPPMVDWHVTVDAPFLPAPYDSDVEARTEVEAKVRGAEHAVSAAEADERFKFPRQWETASREQRVTDAAGYAVASRRSRSPSV